MSATSAKDLTKVDAVIDSYNMDAASLLAILQDVQDAENYLPREAMERVAERLEIPIARVYQMATFFESFHLEPRGKHICTVCMGTACHVRGATRLVEQLERDLEVPSGSTTEDMLFTIEEVNCVGACALGPLVIIDGKYHGNMTSGSLQKVVKKVRKAEDKGGQ
ncbi:MAG: NAD(P)H-dependent oxidoreductase subunit E [Deltaproteobacteria bacterium]|nr:NAD(P)H-dependent oxidoreductase subunit E [Deltaproteobacteria bacterium]